MGNQPTELTPLAAELFKFPPQWNNWRAWYMSQHTNERLAKENPIAEPYAGRPDVNQLQRLHGVPILKADMPPGWLFALINPDELGGVATLEDGSIIQIIKEDGKYKAVEKSLDNGQS